MTIEEQKEIQDKAQSLANTLKNTESNVGRRHRNFYVKGIDPNELKKIYSFICQHVYNYEDMGKVKELLDKLPNSRMCRTNKTRGYYQNINSAFRKEGIYDIDDIEELKQIIGWACRLL
jgi:conjugal transfer/entry exclusion protein